MRDLLYPPVLQWEVTPECNHNCIHCYNYWRNEPEKKEKMINNHLDIAYKIAQRHPVAVVITGGEPLLVFEAIKPSLKLLTENKISVSINTNAALVTDEIAEFLHSLNISAFVSLPCADEAICDSITNVKNSLTKISLGIKTLLKAGVRVSVNMVVSKRNIDYITYTARYAKDELGVTSFFASRVSKPINSSECFNEELLSHEDILRLQKELVEIERDLNIKTSTAAPIPACAIVDDNAFQKFAYKRNCTAGRISYGIDCSGNIKACPRDDKIYGNILTDDFTKVWQSMSDWRTDIFLHKECADCNVKDMCKGGCRLDAFPHTGKRNSLDPAADVTNLPVKFTVQEEKKTFDENQVFVIPNIINFVYEEFAWRVSVASKFMYITPEMKEFLEDCNKFCIADVMQKFNIDKIFANDVLNLLIDGGIVFMHK